MQTNVKSVPSGTFTLSVVIVIVVVDVVNPPGSIASKCEETSCKGTGVSDQDGLAATKTDTYVVDSVVKLSQSDEAPHRSLWNRDEI